MIGRQEILEFAREVRLDSSVVEKDYVLGWLLAAVTENPRTRDTWLFKGGTCLKKCYFETYRFSEDLDFTLLDGGQVDATVLRELFAEIAQWVYDESGIEFPEEARSVEIYRNPRGNNSAQGRLGYRGPLGRTGDLPRIRFDLTHDELVVLPPENRPAYFSERGRRFQRERGRRFSVNVDDPGNARMTGLIVCQSSTIAVNRVGRELMA